jgi:hypothetical protein
LPASEQLALELGPEHHEGARAGAVVRRQELTHANPHRVHLVHGGADAEHHGAPHAAVGAHLGIAADVAGDVAHVRQAASAAASSRVSSRAVDGRPGGPPRGPWRPG